MAGNWGGTQRLAVWGASWPVASVGSSGQPGTSKAIVHPRHVSGLRVLQSPLPRGRWGPGVVSKPSPLSSHVTWLQPGAVVAQGGGGLIPPTAPLCGRNSRARPPQEPLARCAY